MSDVYFVYLNKSAYGPYTAKQIRAMVTTGKMQASTLIFEKGGPQQWLPVVNFPHLLQPPSKKAEALAAAPAATSIPLHAGEIEKTIWEGRPSAWQLLGAAVKCFCLQVLVVVIYTFVATADLFLESDVPMQLRHALVFVVLGLCAVLALGVLWQWICVKTRKWVLSSERITDYCGVFNRKIDSMELYRIKDVKVRKPFLWRLVGCGWVDLYTSDFTDKSLAIGPIRNPDDLYQMIRKYTERQRQRRGVREVDIVQT